MIITIIRWCQVTICCSSAASKRGTSNVSSVGLFERACCHRGTWEAGWWEQGRSVEKRKDSTTMGTHITLFRGCEKELKRNRVPESVQL